MKKVIITCACVFLFGMMLAPASMAASDTGIYINGDPYTPGIHGVTIEGDTVYAASQTTIPCQATNGVARIWDRNPLAVLQVYFFAWFHVGAIDARLPEECPGGRF